jgi:uncharacterized protein YceH (UPF0502 family)
MHDDVDDPGDAGATALPRLDAIEARILGALVEKQATTPEGYPLTANALLLACNQKNNREPVMDVEPGALGHALREMEGRRWVRSVHGARAQRYEHRFAEAFSLTLRQQALLSVLLLRGPQTVNELFSRCERLSDFPDAAAVRDTLDRLAARDPALVVRVSRQPGQREDRYMHLLAGPVAAAQEAALDAAADSDRDAHRTRDGRDAGPRGTAADALAALEARVATLERELAALRDRLGDG